ncbi:MAG: YlcI/YnfO family protein [Ardenticatenaceae bacterium]
MLQRIPTRLTDGPTDFRPSGAGEVRICSRLTASKELILSAGYCFICSMLLTTTESARDRSYIMSRTLSLRLPHSLHKGVKQAAKWDEISMNQFITTAVAEKLSALMTEEYFQERAKLGDRNRYLAALAQVPDVEAEEYDRINE